MRYTAWESLDDLAARLGTTAAEMTDGTGIVRSIWLSIDDATEALGKTPRTLQRWANQGGIKRQYTHGKVGAEYDVQIVETTRHAPDGAMCVQIVLSSRRARVVYASADEHAMSTVGEDDSESAIAVALRAATKPQGVSYVFDSQARNPRYLIRNGADGAVVNQMPGRVHAIARAIGSADDVIARMEDLDIAARAPLRLRLRTVMPDSDRVLLHISLRDVHVGERGDDDAYHREIVRCVSDTIQWATYAHGRIDTIYLPLGSDLLTVDTAWGTTTAGTTIPGASTVQRCMALAERLAIDVIDLCRQACDRVIALTEAGNHDAVTSIAMARVVRAYYRHCPDVQVQIPDGDDDASRTHLLWRDVLISAHHGHVRKPHELPPIVAAEVPDLWGRSSHRYIYAGHRHHSQRWAIGDYGGAEIYQTRSPSRRTAYEHRLGFVADLATLESWIFAPGVGMLTHRRAMMRSSGDMRSQSIVVE